MGTCSDYGALPASCTELVVFATSVSHHSTSFLLSAPILCIEGISVRDLDPDLVIFIPRLVIKAG